MPVRPRWRKVRRGRVGEETGRRGDGETGGMVRGGEVGGKRSGEAEGCRGKIRGVSSNSRTEESRRRMRGEVAGLTTGARDV